MNWRLAAIGLVVVLLGVGAIAHKYGLLLNPEPVTVTEEDVIKINEASVSPIKRPEYVASAVPMLPASVPVAPMVPGLTEEEKREQARIKQIRSNALNASSEVPVIQQVADNRMSQQGYGAAPGVMPMVRQPGDSEVAEPEKRNAAQRAFLNANNEGSRYLAHTREAPLYELEIIPGTIVPFSLLTPIESGLPGQVDAQVSQNVYDSATMQHILIPAGAKLIGWYDSDISTGQERVLIAWNTINYPDGSSLSLGTMPGADQSGKAGMKDQVDNHYFRIFGQAALLSIISAGFQLGQPNNNSGNTVSSGQIFASAIGLQGAALAGQLLRRNMNTPPTLDIRSGMKGVLMITKAIGFNQAWTGHPMAKVSGND
jgi:type IV secretion system protein VirB10